MQKKYVISIILACILFILTGCNNNTTEQTIAMDDLKIGDYIEFGKYDEATDTEVNAAILVHGFVRADRLFGLEKANLDNAMICIVNK